MKTTVKKLEYEKVRVLPRPKRKKPLKPSLIWRVIIRILCFFGMMGSGFSYTTERMELISPKEPCLVLMNHTCFLDMEIAQRILFPRPLNIVCSNDGFIGLFGIMQWVMRQIGCIPTQKYVSDFRLLGDMKYCLKELKTSVLMYPEAGYSFDGTATTLPQHMGLLLKRLDVPVVMIETFGLFTRNPLYNELQIRKNAKVSAKATLIFTRDEIREKSVDQLTEGVENAFGFDHFKWQREKGVLTEQPFRADGLERILYKCPNCKKEQMKGKGTTLVCQHCKKEYVLQPDGQMCATEGETEFPHVPDWYRWEREQVKKEIIEGTYGMEAEVDIAVQVDFKAVYVVGDGVLTHDGDGFRLTGCNGQLDYSQKPLSSYSLYADYYWYEISDCVCIGDNDIHYFCFPKDKSVSVAKLRLAAEEMYKLCKSRITKA